MRVLDRGHRPNAVGSRRPAASGSTDRTGPETRDAAIDWSTAMDASAAYSTSERDGQRTGCVLSIDYCTDRSIALISVWGTVGYQAVEKLSEIVEQALLAHPATVLVDLGPARLDADGLSLLILVERKLARHRTGLVLAGVGVELIRAACRAGLSGGSRMFASVEEALDAIESPAPEAHSAAV